MALAVTLSCCRQGARGGAVRGEVEGVQVRVEQVATKADGAKCWREKLTLAQRA